MRTWGITAAAMMLGVALTGCGGSGSTPKPIDTKAMINELGYTNPPKSAIKHLMKITKRNECTNDQKTDEFEIARYLDDNDADILDQVRITMKYVCPDKVKTWDAARTEVESLQ